MLKDNCPLSIAIMVMCTRSFIRSVHIKFIISFQKFLITIWVADFFFIQQPFQSSVFLLDEATNHFRKAFPALVRFSSDRILTSFMRMSKRFVQQRNIASDITVFTYSKDQDDG